MISFWFPAFEFVSFFVSGLAVLLQVQVGKEEYNALYTLKSPKIVLPFLQLCISQFQLFLYNSNPSSHFIDEKTERKVACSSSFSIRTWCCVLKPCLQQAASLSILCFSLSCLLLTQVFSHCSKNRSSMFWIWDLIKVQIVVFRRW